MPIRATASRTSRVLLTLLASSVALGFACGGGADEERANVSPTPPGATGTVEPVGPNGGGDAAAAPDGSPPDVSTVDAGPPAVRYIGRFDARDPAGPICAWPGCRIVANFSGTEVKARLEERVEAWMEGGPSEWDVIIDGVLRPKLVLELGAHDYSLATGLAPGAHRIELYKRSETQNGYTRFLGYDFAGGTLLPPPLPAAHKIEIVGDSAPAAFGIEGVGQGDDCPGPNWAARWQNFHRSLGARLGEITAADIHGTVYSGKGLVRNIWRPDPFTMPILYTRANPVDPTSAFDLGSYVPDVYIMMMGGNDFALGQPVDDGPTPLPEFTQALRDLVTTFRTRAPLAHVFLALSPSVSDAQPPDRQSRTNVKSAFDTVAAERAAAGDLRVYSVAPPVAAPSELTGCEGHGSPEFHERVAQQLATMVKAKTGW